MKKRFLSLIIALAMMVGVFTPLLTSAEGEHETTVNIHKVLMSKDDKVGDTNETVWSKFPKEHDGQEIKNITDYFGESAKLIAGVTFDIYREAKTDEPEGTVKVKGSDIASSVFEAEKEYVLVESVTTKGETNPKATATLVDGTYYVAENKEKSTYVGVEGEKLTGMKAVPFKLVLPAGLPDGTGNYSKEKPLNVYPKNTEDKVVATKDFAKKSTETTTKLGEEDVKTKKLNSEDKDPAYENYKAEKDLVNQTVGKTVPYIVKTKIPQNSVLTNLNWSDLMDKGLTYNEKSLNVKIGDNELIANGVETENYKGWFTLKETVSGFTLEATETGLKEIAKLAKDGEVEFKLNYSATVNEDAVVDTPMDNHITVDYGNNPDGGFDVEKGKTEVSIEKTWAEGQAPANAKVKYFLIEKDTGKVVDQVTKEGNDLSHKFTGLNKEKEYKIVEVFDGYRPTYEKTENGVKITNTETPTTIVPTPPQVETYGKKFVKTNNETGEKEERLQGAQFIVKTSDNKYLGLKDAETQKANKETYDKAQAAYIEAVEKKANDIEAKKQARDTAFAALKMQWDYVDDKANAFVFTSNEKGQFEVMGLEQGKYTLVEIKAPAGYAVPSNPEKEFNVGPLTASSREVNIKYDKDTDKTNNAQQITNTKVTIPQTGGIGTIIFTAIGLAIMASAIIAIKKRQATEAR